MLPNHQTVVRHFAFNFNRTTMPEVTSNPVPGFLETIRNGHSIVFFATLAQSQKIRAMCALHDVPLVELLSKDSLRSWQRVHTSKANGVLLVHSLVSTGWYAYADRVLWVDNPEKPAMLAAQDLDQAGQRIRGKTVQPIIFRPEDIK